MDRKFDGLGFFPADIMLPEGTDMEKWAVVACDQFTSQPEYWQQAGEIASGSPSTLNLMLPEYLLGGDDEDARISRINKTMDEYMASGLFKTYEDAYFYVERTQSDGAVRHGIIGMVDLEQYEFAPGNQALIRATEGTVLSRIPPRVKVREGASLELPHIMLLIDDPEKTVIEPLSAEAPELNKLYDFDLMLGGGHIKGYQLGETQKAAVLAALKGLCSEEEMQKKYGIACAPMLFAVGDGNHSLATAKKCYENVKAVTPESEWAGLKERYALVEVVNNHDDALKFEPIHRVVFNVDAGKVLEALLEFYPEAEICHNVSPDELAADLAEEVKAGKAQIIGYCHEGESGSIVFHDPARQLAVGTLQEFLDKYLNEAQGASIDYIHGDDVTMRLGSEPGNMGFLLPAMGKDMLFKTVIMDGVLPRKTFSMGHAQDKRYYLECRVKRTK